MVMAKAKRKPPPPEPTLGPTREARQHGAYSRPETRGSLAVYTNGHESYLGVLLSRGSITKQQCAGGVRFDATYGYVWGTASPSRDSTIPGIGGTVHETEAQAERMALARARLHTILNRVGPRAYSLLVSVCAFGEILGRDRGRNAARYELLRSGLDQCAIVYGVD